VIGIGRPTPVNPPAARQQKAPVALSIDTGYRAAEGLETDVTVARNPFVGHPFPVSAHWFVPYTRAYREYDSEGGTKGVNVGREGVRS
jgi:hypothetical protein